MSENEATPTVESEEIQPEPQPVDGDGALIPTPVEAESDPEVVAGAVHPDVIPSSSYETPEAEVPETAIEWRRDGNYNRVDEEAMGITFGGVEVHGVHGVQVANLSDGRKVLRPKSFTGDDRICEAGRDPVEVLP